MEINNFRESFERGEDPLADMTDASDINSVCGVLKLYLRELREPVFSVQYFDQFMDLASKSYEYCTLLILTNVDGRIKIDKCSNSLKWKIGKVKRIRKRETVTFLIPFFLTWYTLVDYRYWYGRKAQL